MQLWAHSALEWAGWIAWWMFSKDNRMQDIGNSWSYPGYQDQRAPPTNYLCFWALSLSRIICLWLPTSTRVDIHEVNCYSNWPTLHRMMTATFNSQHVFHNYPQHELVVSAHSENITFGHNWVLPADRHDPTTRCYHTDAPRHPFDRISRWLVFCTCTASKFLIREVYRSRCSERTHEYY